MGKTINLDHDYCTAKQKPDMFKRVSQRKAIEIPIVDATIDKKSNRTTNIKKEENPSTKMVSVGNKRAAPVELVSEGVQVSLLKVTANMSNESTETTSPASNPSTVKRKLNLAEYMQRQESRAAIDQKSKAADVVEDPILAATRKVLRKQALKKEAKMKDMEPKIDNVPLLPILPLAEITGMSKETEQEPIRVLTNSDYEEIVIVSMGVNTDISIPPAAEDEKSLLAYVNDTIKKVKNSKDRGVVQFSNSLLSSIQDVVLKKGNACLTSTDLSSPDCGQTPSASPGKTETAKSKSSSPSHLTEEGKESEECKESDHGEDKTIMHLRKNRPRPETRSTSMQTLEVPSFVPLRRLSPLPHATRHGATRSKSRDDGRRSQRDRRSASRHSSRRNCSRSPSWKRSAIEHFRRSRSRQRTLSRNSESSTCSSGSSSSSSSSSSCDGNFKRDGSPYRPTRNHVYYNSASSRRSSSSYSSRSRSRESIRYRPVSRGRDHNRMRQNEDPGKNT